MQPIKNQQTQRNMPPLPPATLVIDMRGEGEDVISMLEIEIRNLTEEMKQQNVRLWSSLIDFISFKAMEPIGDDDIAKLSSSTQTQNQQTLSSSQSADATRVRGRSLTGVADQLDAAGSFPPQFQASNQSETEDEQDDPDMPHVEFADLIEEIDRLRNMRINAVSNLGVDGTVGRNVKEPGVRIIFLADARHSNSLMSIAACSWYLKKYYRRLERANEQAGQQIPINVSVLCLNHLNTDQSIAPTRLIQGLRWEGGWDHLDALILSEKYRQDIGRVDNDTQNLLAELLLYVLLIVSPALARIRPSAPRTFEEEDEKPDEQRVSLPPNTFLVGLSSIENSTRWGYQLLNYGLAEQALQILLDGNPSNEQAMVGDAIENWLNDLRMHVRSALPDQLPKDIPDMHGLTLAERAGSPTQEIFSNSQLSLTLGDRSIRELENYLHTLTATYNITNSNQDRSLQDKSPLTSGVRHSPTLQDAILSIPQIESVLDQWDNGEPETPLVKAQLDAYRVLSHPRLFQGPRGAVPRAKVQLRELANATAALQGKLAQSSVDVKAKQEALQKAGQSRIDELQEHNKKWPFFASFLGLKVPMAWATTIFALFLCFALVILSFAWLQQAFDQFIPGAFQLVSDPLLGIAAFNIFYLILVITLVILLIVVIFRFGRSLLAAKRSPLSVEITFGIVLLAIVFVGLLTGWSYGFVSTSLGQTVLSWYPSGLRVWISSLAFFIFLIMVIVEFFYYSWWRKEVEQERERIAEAIRAMHQKNINDVVAYIVDRLTLHLLVSAGLGDEKTRNSAYYKRVDELNYLLANTYTYVKEERRLAEGRLGSNLNESSLRIRQELLDVAALKRGYKRLGVAMVHKRSELRELTELLLRTMGEEMPHHIERQYREKAPSTDREAYYMQILMEALTAVALRFSTTIPASDMLTPLEERYEEMDGQNASHLAPIRLLVDELNKKMKTADLDEDENIAGSVAGKGSDVQLAARAVAAWSQTLWEKKDHELDFVLASGGVIAKLMSKGYNSQTVKETLGMRTSPSGRSLITRLHDELYLFVAPTPESRKFLRDFLPERYIADFPDSERLLLMHIQHYVARPIIVSRGELGPGAQSSVIDADNAMGADQSADVNGSSKTGGVTITDSLP